MIKAFALAALQAYMATACENALKPSEPCTEPPKEYGCDVDWKNCPENFPKLCDNDSPEKDCSTSNWRL